MITNRQIAGVGIACFVIAILASLFILNFNLNNGSIDDFFSGFGTTQMFSLTQEFTNMRCEEFNEIWINSGGNLLQVASFSERETIFIDEQFQNKLTLSASGKTVDAIHIKLFLECDGNAMNGSTIVSGTVKLRERIGSSPEIFFLGTDRPISTFAIRTITPTVLQDGDKKEIFEYVISRQVIESALSSKTGGSQHFKSEMLPILKFGFNHPQVGVFSGSFDSEQFGSTITAQFSFGFVQDIVTPTETTITSDPNLDTDSDGIIDSNDSCPLLPETINQYNDSDGCPDTPPDTDGDGIIDANDSCPIQPENFNGISDSDGCPDSSPTPLDTDGDGIEDLFDSCVSEPENFNGFQDGDGCPDVLESITSDSDGDGINDTLDLCPMEAETFNGVNDSDGCPDEVQESSDGSDVAETTLGDDSIGSTQIIPFAQVSDDDPTALIVIIIIFVGFVGSVILLNRRRNK